MESSLTPETEKTLVGKKRVSASRLVVSAIALCLAAGGIAWTLKEKAPPSSDEILANGLAIGYVPAEEQPPMGKAIYQWDPEIEKDVPHLLGPVIGQNVVYHDQHLTRVRQTPHRNLLLEIKTGEMRYWVRK